MTYMPYMLYALSLKAAIIVLNLNITISWQNGQTKKVMIEFSNVFPAPQNGRLEAATPLILNVPRAVKMTALL